MIHDVSSLLENTRCTSPPLGWQ